MSQTEIKSFQSSQEESRDSEETAPDVTVKIDGREITFMGPNATESTFLMMNVSGSTNILKAVASSIDLILGLIKDDMDRRWLEQSLLDRRNPMSIELVTDVVLYLIEEWFTRPTQEQSTSSGPPSPTGRKSTASRHRKASSHSTSAPAAS